MVGGDPRNKRTEENAVVPKIVAAGDGELLEFDDWAAVIKIAAEESDGTMTVLETRHDPGNDADAHTHSRESEIFFVLEGRVTFTVGDALHEVGPGATVFGPVGTAHGFEVGPNGGRLLHVFVPSGIEGYFREMHADKADGGADYIAIRRHYGVTTQG